MVESSEEIRKLPVLSHSSQVKTRATCNCGRRQGEREDPFDHRVCSLNLQPSSESFILLLCNIRHTLQMSM